MYKRGTCLQTKKSGTQLKNRVRKAKVQNDFVRNANDNQGPESFLWSKMTNKKERFNLWENNIMSRDGREKEKLFIFFSLPLYKKLNFIYLSSI